MADRSVRTVHRAVDDGELTPAMQAGEGGNAPYLFERAEVERWIADRKARRMSGTHSPPEVEHVA